MSEQIEYKIVEGSAEMVIREVTEKLNEGWELHGTLCVTDQSTPWYAQAIVRKPALTRARGRVHGA